MNSHVEKVHLRGALVDATCAAHDRPSLGLARWLIDEMRRLHGKGGINVCIDCLKRARNSVKP